MPVLWPLFARRREPFTLGETLSRAGCGLLLEEKNPDRRQLPNVEWSRDQVAVSHGIKNSHPGCRRAQISHRHIQLVATVNGQVRYEDVKRSKDRSETLSRGRIKRHQGVSKIGIAHNGKAFCG
jgi:hypothetical protein